MAGTRTFFDHLMSIFRGPGQGYVDIRKSPHPAASHDEPPLGIESATYQAHQRDLLMHVGQWVVIHGDQVLGVRPSYEEALRLGYEQAGFANFLVHRIAEDDPVHSLPPQPV
jgi:hypothetical protein